MAVRLVAAPEAEFDISEAFIWYESRRAGLGVEFLCSLDACIERIRPDPANSLCHLLRIAARAGLTHKLCDSAGKFTVSRS
jgi:hypothetical protein